MRGLWRGMARLRRFQYPGAVYHVMARGDGGKTVFENDGDRLVFLSRLGEACGSCGWRVHAWVLMGNHFHLLHETPPPNLVAHANTTGQRNGMTIRMDCGRGVGCGVSRRGRWRGSGIKSDEFRVVVDAEGGDDEVERACVEPGCPALLTKAGGIAPKMVRSRKER